MSESPAAQMREQREREARLALPVITATVLMTGGNHQTIRPYLNHEVADNGTLVLHIRDRNGDPWPALTVAPSHWVSVNVDEPEADR